ncbi:uncharacterized protein LOC105252266 [Camponotus floridanus]|uniref:uncharacterized protein LOC105252266 n=1 Tax=Camponotus floridanus TaxID=104421 RepID=UPI000DC69E42|nr:uncharacterized protein LOC105252266 [Camponotus floridanus]
MPGKEDCHHNIIYITQPTRNIMRALGVWPSNDRERSMRLQACNFLLICISYTFLSCDLIPGILFWLMEKSTRIRLQTIPLLLYDIMSVSQYGIFIFRRDQLKRCLKHIEEDWENIINVDMRNIMLKSAKMGKRLATICGIFMYTGFIMVSVVISACGLTAIFVVHACGQLKILISLMRSLVQESWQEEHEVDKKLAQIVKHQIRMRSFLKLVQHTLQEIYLIEIMAEKVSIESCELEWYRLPNRTARSVILLMIMSNTPTKLSAGKFADLSLKTFGDVIKSSGAYFNMLRSVIE